ncbi:TPA: HNH endonuclease [Candidatus Woesearchaeota archaeon]|nr:HNH endonuclease [Candidatus Woesearchaeota archaeon]HIH31509.1 HNH endonuclease [Candidatus Woesearchaeota archaeon]HIJ01130.1 HNH endonuclease [Candidatus Woesearchaeota archaeon]HIJ13898.1 HNH endonuclease [Candidatus Woesearchaeota archaeon]
MPVPLKLTIELVPSTVWYASIYQYYKKTNNPQKWVEIKKELFAKEGNKCWICEKESKPLDAHEFWKYDDVKHIQRLDAIHHLCRLCHKIKHIGLWLHTEDGERMLIKEGLTKEDVIKHFCNVNKCSIADFQKFEDDALKVWAERSKDDWKQDFGAYEPKLTKSLNNSTLKQFTRDN